MQRFHHPRLIVSMGLIGALVLTVAMPSLAEATTRYGSDCDDLPVRPHSREVLGLQRNYHCWFPCRLCRVYEVGPDSDDVIQHTCVDLPPPYLPPPEPESPPPQPQDPTAVETTQEKAQFANNKREAQRDWSMCRVALDNAANQELDLNLSQEDFANAQKSISNASLYPAMNGMRSSNNTQNAGREAARSTRRGNLH